MIEKTKKQLAQQQPIRGELVQQQPILAELAQHWQPQPTPFVAQARAQPALLLPSDVRSSDHALLRSSNARVVARVNARIARVNARTARAMRETLQMRVLLIHVSLAALAVILVVT